MVLGNLQSLPYFLPELAVTATILLVIAAHVAGRNRRSPVPAVLALVGAGAAVVLASLVPPPERLLFEGMVALDRFAVFFKVLTALATIVVVFMSMDSAELAERSQAEYYVFLLSVLLGMFLLSSAADIVMVYLSLELVSIPSYLLAGYLKGRGRSTEAAMKYVVYGATASGVMIYGFSLLYGLAGSTRIDEIGRAVASGGGPSLAVLLAVAMVTVGFGYKIAAVPFHMWSPDVYEGAPTAVTAFLSVGPKAAGFAVLVRVFYTAFVEPGGTPGAWRTAAAVDWTVLFAVLAAVTMTVGNLVAVAQSNVKRLLAYSSIAHAGYMMMGFVLLTDAGLRAILFYLVVYLFMNLGAFYVVLLVTNGAPDEDIARFRGLGSRAPVCAVSMAVFLFSLTGIPPFSGFIGKVYLFAETINRELYWLVVVAGLNSVVALYYYVRIVKAMFLDEPAEAPALRLGALPTAIVVILAVPTVLLGIYWEPVIRVAEASVRMLVR